MKEFVFTMVSLVVLAACVLVVAWRDAKKRGVLATERLSSLEAAERREQALEARSQARRSKPSKTIHAR